MPATPGGGAALNRLTDPARRRWDALDDEAREDFRTALRDFVRAHSSLAQLVPFKDTELDEPYYHGKYLVRRLPRADSGGSVDVDGAVVLTHLRAELVAEQEVLSLQVEEAEPLAGLRDGGRGREHEEPVDRLSALIETLNERFGMHLGEPDRIWFQQQALTLAEDDEVRNIAVDNNFHQFGVFLEPRVEEKVVERHGANDALFQAFFDKPEFRDEMVKWLSRTLYDGIRTVSR